MAKKQTRRSISVSRVTYERLKAFCETNNISMSQFVETRVGDFLGEGEEGASPTASLAGFVRPAMTETRHVPSHNVHSTSTMTSSATASHAAPRPSLSSVGPAPVRAPMAAMSSPPAPRAPAVLTSAAARFAVEPPPPIIKPRQDQPAPPPTARTADQIFTF